MRTPLIVLAVAVLPIAAAAQPVPPGGGLAVLRPCATAQLRASVLENTGATLHRELRIGLTNIAQRACAIDGYPAVRLLSAEGNVEIVAEQFAPAPAPHLFTIAPGQQSVFRMRVATGDGAITYRTAPTLGIVPPGDVTPLKIPLELPIARTMDVTAVLPPNELP